MVLQVTTYNLQQPCAGNWNAIAKHAVKDMVYLDMCFTCDALEGNSLKLIASSKFMVMMA